MTTINLLSSGICLLYSEVKLFRKAWPHYINLPIRVHLGPNYLCSKLSGIINKWDLLELGGHVASHHTNL